MTLEDILKQVPGPSPWYFGSSHPELHTKDGQASWKDLGGSKPLMLVSTNNEVLGLVGMYNYIAPLTDSRFLIWNQHKPRDWLQGFPNRGVVPRDSGSTAPVQLAIYDLDKLSSINSRSKLLKQFDYDQIAYHFEGDPLWELDIPTTSLADQSHEFPTELASHGEVIVIARSSAVSYAEDDRAFNICLVDILPQEGTVRFYPQDWFNQGSYDHSYVWITRVTRDPDTKRIVGEGMRLGEFILDETNRNRVD